MTEPTHGGEDGRRERAGDTGLGRRLSRRDFIKLTTAATAGGYAALSGLAAVTGRDAADAACRGGGGGCGGSSSGIPLDPPPGAYLLDPQPLAGTTYDPLTHTLSGTITAKAAPVTVGGVNAELLTYNGQYPGPLIRLAPRDKLHLTFINQLPSWPANILGHPAGVTSLHTHGWHVSPDTEDNVMRQFQPRQWGVFDYDLVNQDAGTLCWYHPHIHELTAQQVWAGMHGLLLIDDPPEANDAIAPQVMEQHILVLKDISIADGRPALHGSTMDYMHGKEGDLVMVNGQLNPVLPMYAGQVQRLRLLNASSARFYKLQLQGHSLHVIGTDGGLLEKPYAQSYVLMSPGERLDVLVKASGTPGSYKLLALPYSRMGMMASSQRTLMTVKVGGSGPSMSVPSWIGPALPLPPDLDMVPRRTFKLSMGQGRGYINGLDFDGPAGPCTVDSEVMDMDMYELWTIQNQSNMDHPWHQHTNPAQVMSISGGDSAYRTLYTTSRAWKDVVIVPKMGSVTQLVRIRHYTGMAMFHCHILEHEDIGMMGVWNLGEMPMEM